MATPTSEQALETIRRGQEALDSILAKLSDEAMALPSTIGATGWSAKDLLGHLAFWEELAIEAVADWKAGRPLAFWRLFDGEAGGVDGANACNLSRGSGQTLDEVRRRASLARAGVVGAILALSAEEWDATIASPTGRTSRLGDFVGGILGAEDQPYGHVFAHLSDLEDYVKRASAPNLRAD